LKIIYKENSKQRIDKYLAYQKIDQLYSRTHIKKLINSGDITVNDKNIKNNYQLEMDDVIIIQIPKPKKVEVIPQNIPLEFLYEDEYLVVVNKPINMAVHPAPGHPQETLVNALMYKLNGKLSLGNHALRPGIVHRLDLDTSGALIVAKDDRTHSLLSKMFQERKIEKIYHAIVVSEPKENSGTIDTFIERSKINRIKMTVSESGKRAITHYKILEYFDIYSYVEIELETGRTHQIRVHFSHINCPILGDETYSTLKRTLNMLPNHYHKKLKHLLANHLKRQALHAYKLRFIHPITKKEIKVIAPIPSDMKYTLEWLRENYADLTSV